MGARTPGIFAGDCSVARELAYDEIASIFGFYGACAQAIVD